MLMFQSYPGRRGGDATFAYLLCEGLLCILLYPTELNFCQSFSEIKFWIFPVALITSKTGHTGPGDLGVTRISVSKQIF